MQQSNIPVKLQTENGLIDGVSSFSHTGKETNQVLIIFNYNGLDYKMPFSRKTGKLYGMRLKFEIKLIIDGKL